MIQSHAKRFGIKSLNCAGRRPAASLSKRGKGKGRSATNGKVERKHAKVEKADTIEAPLYEDDVEAPVQ
jgi:hypothetical protein